MKPYASIVLVIVSVLLAIALFVTKHSDNAQLETNITTITDFSNRLDTAQSQITAQTRTIHSLAETSLTFSNRLTEAQSIVAMQSDKITSLNGKITTASAENEVLSRSTLELTNQMAALTQRLASTEASLTQTNQELLRFQKDYTLLQNRFQRDVAERVVLERKFNSLSQLEAQIEKVSAHPERMATPESIYAGLNVEINSNGVARVISPE